jgi:hypothetical protein
MDPMSRIALYQLQTLPSLLPPRYKPQLVRYVANDEAVPDPFNTLPTNRTCKMNKAAYVYAIVTWLLGPHTPATVDALLTELGAMRHRETEAGRATR